MSSLDPEYVRLAGRLADRAREMVRAKAGSFSVTYKSDGSPVTDVDLAVEEALREMLSQEAPGHGVLGEEHPDVGLDREYVWVLDPIDGTRQFVAGLPNFGVLIALCRNGQPIIGVIEQPLTAQRWVGVQGVGTTLNDEPVQVRDCRDLASAIANMPDPDCITDRTRDGFEAVRSASRWNVYDGGCLGFGALASGHLDLCLYGSNVDPFDICALVPVVEAAGGCISTWNGQPIGLATRGAIVASATQALHDQALGLLQSS